MSEIKKQLEGKSFIVIDFEHFKKINIEKTELIRLADAEEILSSLTPDVKGEITGIELIAKERREQIEKHGYDIIHDDQHNHSELYKAGLAVYTKSIHPWPSYWYLGTYDHIMKKNDIDQLAIAGAFLRAEQDRLERYINKIAAEIDRLQSPPQKGESKQ